jgi:hypothetical protein
MERNSLTQTEPVSLTAALTAAINSTLGILAILFEWSSDVSNGLLVASGAWITVLFLLLARPQVTPNVNVALTKDQESLINLGKAESVSAQVTDAVVIAPAGTPQAHTHGK